MKPAIATVLTVLSATMTQAQFGDANRRAKLSTAFAEVDRVFTEFATRQHVPGAAWGIVIDGELAHSGAHGFRDLATRSPVNADTDIVAHSGGLPGFGSIMRWLPEYGVGVIAFGNLTYTGWGRTADLAIEQLAKTGGLQRRAVTPSPALVEARDAVTKLVLNWDDTLADRIAAENLFLDIDKERRRQEINAARAKVGDCKPGGPFDVENALRGQWAMTCERGKLRVAITLAPSNPPTVQFLQVVRMAPTDGLPARTSCAP